MSLDKVLETYRSQIDSLDKEIVYLLSRRFELVNQIGNIKKDMGEKPLQLKRWSNVLNKVFAEADELGISREFIENIWNEIHKESLKIEK